MSKVSKETIAILKSAGTAVIGDVADNLGLKPEPLANDLWPTRGSESEPFAGPAYTVGGVPCTDGAKGDRPKLKAIDEMPEDCVALWAGNGMQGICCFGDLLASAMKCRGVAGVVVDGGIRDLGFLRTLELSMMVQYASPAQAIGRWRVTDCQVPVEVRGAIAERVTIHPGDIIVADEDGVIVVPAGRADEFARLAADWESKDQAAREDIMNGMKLLDAIEKYGAL
ncbi:MAG: RraA family protein [bacterium]|nr:RraA family protein [bacterium]